MKKYDVTFEEKNIWQITLNAKNEEDAIEKAKKILVEQGTDDAFIACGLWEENWEATS